MLIRPTFRGGVSPGWLNRRSDSVLSYDLVYSASEDTSTTSPTEIPSELRDRLLAESQALTEVEFRLTVSNQAGAEGRLPALDPEEILGRIMFDRRTAQIDWALDLLRFEAENAFSTWMIERAQGHSEETRELAERVARRLQSSPDEEEELERWAARLAEDAASADD